MKTGSKPSAPKIEVRGLRVYRESNQSCSFVFGKPVRIDIEKISVPESKQM